MKIIIDKIIPFCFSVLSIVSFFALFGEVGSFSFPFSYEEIKEVREKIQTIPTEECENLEIFFNALMRSEFGYTLVGEKPMSFEGWETNHLYSFVSYPEELLLVKGWESWQKVHHLFPSQNFLLRISNEIFFDATLTEFQERNPVYLILLNKQACCEVIRDNIDLFQKVLGRSIEAEVVWELLATSPKLFKNALNSHEELLGILLGFGRNNSLLFQKRKDLLSTILTICLSPFGPPSVLETFKPEVKDFLKREVTLGNFSRMKEKNLLFDKGETLVQEYFQIKQELKAFDDNVGRRYVDVILLPEFACIKEDQETQILESRYSKCKKTITKLLKNYSALEIFLLYYVYGGS